jgi:hypothetical protein
MSSKGLDEQGKEFLRLFYELTEGNPSVQVSMYAIGERLGLARDVAAAVAEDLMGRQLIEIRTLSGGIGWSVAGLEVIQELFSPGNHVTEEAYRLGDAPILDQTATEAVQQVIGGIKNGIGQIELEFEQLSEMMADLKSIDAQLQSPRPKTAVIRACLHSLHGVLQQAAGSDLLRAVEDLLGERRQA